MSPRCRTDSEDDRAVLLTDLASFAKGAAAEFDTRELLRTHLPIPEHRRVLDRDTLLVLGGRGSGKTQLFRVLRALDNPAALLEPSARGIHDAHQEQRDHYTAGFGGAGQLFPRSETLASLLSAGQLSDFRRFWAGLLTGVLIQYEPTKPALSSALGADLCATFSADLSMPSRWLSAIGDSAAYERLLNALDRAHAALDGQGRSLTVTYDDLDRLVAQAELSSAYPLIRELLAFWLDNVRRWTAIRGKIFLRTDIFTNEAIAFTDSSKLRPLSVTLRWNADNLYRLVLKRLLNGEQQEQWLRFISRSISISKRREREPFGIVPTTDEIDHRAFMARLIGEYMGSDRRRGDTYQWFLNHLQDSLRDIAPRSFLRLFELAAEGQINAGPPRDSKTLLMPEQVAGALMQVSRYRIGELEEEYKWIEGLGKRLHSRVVPEGRATFRTWVRDIEWDRFPDQVRDKPDRLIDYLISLGILRETNDKKIHVPDIYLFGFGLKRKGGIRRPRA
jgi:hypothetical protein